MARMPGALWKPVTKSRAARRKGRGICLHVAVSEAASLQGYFQGASSDSHFYVRKDGTIEQYVDTDLVAYANAAGNATMISVETQGGTVNADSEPWTPQQVDALARLCAWTSQIDGFPLQLMPNSLPTSRGVGYHRLGCRPWVVAGGELWSSATGKICPGAGKIAQIPAIITTARGGTAPASPATPVEEDDMDIWDIVNFRPGQFDGQQRNLFDSVNQLLANQAKQTAQIAAQQASIDKLIALAADSNETFDAAEFRTVLREELANAVIDVDVSVSDRPAST